MTTATANTTPSSLNPYCLEVCQGPDCFGAGGGAALLELEELVQECHYQQHHANDTAVSAIKISIQKGACRNACTMGPNVYLNEQHFTKVNGIAECRAILPAALLSVSREDDTDEQVPFSRTTQMMLSKAERQRWQCLRQLARFQKQQSTSKKRQLPRVDLVEACLAMEQQAVRNHPTLVERAARRKERLEQKIKFLSTTSSTSSQS